MSNSTLHSALSGPDQEVVITTTSRTTSDDEAARVPDSPRTESQQPVEEDIISPTGTAINLENSGTASQIVAPKEAATPGTTQSLDAPPTAATLPSTSPHIRRSKVLWPKVLTRSHDEEQCNLAPQWGVHWYSPTCMLTLLVLGFSTMLGHHLFNDRLHGRQVHDPQWPQRWGLAMSTFGKVCLAGAVEIAYKQRLWITVKKRSFKIKTLNGIFSACYDPLEFLNIELIRRATMMTLLAGLIWTLPLCVIVSPATLTSISTIWNTSTICDNIQTIEFTHDNNANISAPIEASVVNDG